MKEDSQFFFAINFDFLKLSKESDFSNPQMAALVFLDPFLS